MVVFIWGIWNQKNVKVFKWKEDFDQAHLVDWVSSYLEGLRSAYAKTDTNNHNKRTDQWKPLEEGVYKINTDAAVSLNDSNAGLGIIIRNHRGQVIASETKYLEFVSSVDEAEARAALEGLKFAIEAGIHPIQLEVDSLRIYNLFCKEMEKTFQNQEKL